MRMHRFLAKLFLTFSIIATASVPGQAAEYGFSTYGLGESAFSAGVTPPPGTYMTAVTGYYSGHIAGAVSFGGITLNAGVKADALSTGLNLL